MRIALYYLGLACLFTHELDAITHSEWRLLFVLGNMPDATALPLFVVLHVPLFFSIMWLSQHQNARVRNVTQVTVASFLVVHAALHLRLSSAPTYEFHGTLSRALILSAAVFGIAFLLARWRSRPRAESAVR